MGSPVPRASSQRRFRKAVVGFLKRYTIHIAVAYAVLSLGSIPAAILVFPSTTLTLSILISVSGFLGAIVGLGSLLLDIDDADD